MIAMQEQQHSTDTHEQTRQPSLKEAARGPRAELAVLGDAIFGQQRGYLALFSGRRAGKHLVAVREAFYRWPGDVRLAETWVRREAGQERELYTCAHLLTRPVRRKDAAAPVGSLYADVDHDRIPASVPAPTVVVESSPGKLQAYWRLTELLAPSAAAALNRRLAHALGADPSGWDLTQLLRVPGTRNYKYPEAPLVRLLALSKGRYAATMFDQLLPPVPAEPAVPRPPGPRTALPAAGGEILRRLSRPAQAVWSGEVVKLTPEGAVDRSASLVRIARVLYEAGVPPAEIVSALAERDVSLGWHKYSERPNVLEHYQGIVVAVARGARTRRRTSS